MGLSAEERLRDSLAERLYAAHREWQANLSESSSAHPYWFALHEDLKRPYRKAASAMIAAEEG